MSPTINAGRPIMTTLREAEPPFLETERGRLTLRKPD